VQPSARYAACWGGFGACLATAGPGWVLGVRGFETKRGASGVCVCVCVCVCARAHARTRVVPRLWLVLVSLPTRTFPFRTRPRPRAAGAARARVPCEPFTDNPAQTTPPAPFVLSGHAASLTPY